MPTSTSSNMWVTPIVKKVQVLWFLEFHGMEYDARKEAAFNSLIHSQGNGWIELWSNQLSKEPTSLGTFSEDPRNPGIEKVYQQKMNIWNRSTKDTVSLDLIHPERLQKSLQALQWGHLDTKDSSATNASILGKTILNKIHKFIARTIMAWIKVDRGIIDK